MYHNNNYSVDIMNGLPPDIIVLMSKTAVVDVIQVFSAFLFSVNGRCRLSVGSEALCKIPHMKGVLQKKKGVLGLLKFVYPHIQWGQSSTTSFSPSESQPSSLSSAAATTINTTEATGECTVLNNNSSITAASGLSGTVETHGHLITRPEKLRKEQGAVSVCACVLSCLPSDQFCWHAFLFSELLANTVAKLLPEGTRVHTNFKYHLKSSAHSSSESHCTQITNSSSSSKCQDNTAEALPATPSSGYFELDIWIPSFQLAIEHQGRQHYLSDSMFCKRDPLAHVQSRDTSKQRECEKLGITLIHVPYWLEKEPHKIAQLITSVRPDITLL